MLARARPPAAPPRAQTASATLTRSTFRPPGTSRPPAAVRVAGAPLPSAPDAPARRAAAQARGPRRRPAAASPPAKKRRRVAATAAAAARRRSAAVQLPGLSVLETGSITAATRAQYVEAFDGFQAWMAERGVQPTTLDDYDEQLVLRLDELYLDGEGIGAGQKLFASVLFFLGLTKAAGSPMARARRALRGFRRLAPPTSRLPLPFELPAALVNYLVSVSKLEAALVLWLSFELYLRPSEPYHIRATDVVRPARGRLGHDSWSVTLHAAETEVLSKTAEYDEALKLDLPRQELLGPALEASVTARLGPDWRRPRPAAARGAAAGGRASGAAPEPLLFAITQREVSSALSAAAKALGIEKFLPGLHPYMLRHGGASHDYGSKARSLVDVQRRGRWQSWHSVRRYEKGARLSQVLQMVPAAMQVFSGSGRLGRAVAAEGLPVLLWDICLGPEYDLLSPQKRGLIRSWVRSGLVIGIHIGTPCNTWSRARDIPPGPMPLRSDAFPLGLPDLSVKDQAKVDAGNVFMIFSAGLMHEAIRANIPASNENPQTSRLWLAPPFVRLLRSSAVTFTVTHFCQWGAPLRKATAFATVNLDMSRIGRALCKSSKRGICSRTGLPHAQLHGKDVERVFKTKLAEAYPQRLCNALAQAYSNAVISHRAPRRAATSAPHVGGAPPARGAHALWAAGGASAGPAGARGARDAAAGGSVPSPVQAFAPAAPPLGEEKVVSRRDARGLALSRQDAAAAAGVDARAAARSPALADAPLSASGRAQAVRLGARLRGAGVQVVAASPLRRAYQSARLVFPEVQLCLLECLRERRTGSPSDMRGPRAEIAAALGGPRTRLDLSGLDGEADPAPPGEREPRAAGLERARRAVAWLLARPEHTLAVVSHALLLEDVFSPRCGVLRLQGPGPAPAPINGAAAPLGPQLRSPRLCVEGRRRRSGPALRRGPVVAPGARAERRAHPQPQ
ncbi:unnamed protein product [Prorocentrum cordatum]|uniref:Uncharacterized protein n=1 Tax=Prorocentrum cordatum TaxID=2364126 RepID=A0ABN9WCF0_9DINO|nr:unnamed protein product [Polarella glacialis]